MILSGEESTMTDPVVIFGNPEEHARFYQRYHLFLLEWTHLQETVKEVMLNRLINPPDMTSLKDLPDDDAKVIEAEDRYKADLSCFVLARVSVDDFSELLTLASNGWGNGALKILRGMYEHTVTSEYVALFPAVSRSLVEDTWTHKWRELQRAKVLMPDLVSSLDPNDIEDLKKKAAEAKARKNESFCKSCNQLIEVHSWTKVPLDTMAAKVDERLTELGIDHARIADLYLRCYLQPTALQHASGTCINEKFAFIDGGWTYKMDTSQEVEQAMIHGHSLLLILLGYQNAHFNYGLGEKLKARIAAFRDVWSKFAAEADSTV